MVDQMTFFRTEMEQSPGTEPHWPPMSNWLSCCLTPLGTTVAWKGRGCLLKNWNYPSEGDQPGHGTSCIWLLKDTIQDEKGLITCHCSWRKGAYTGRMNMREQQKLSLKMELRRSLILFFLLVHPKRYFVVNTLSESRIHDFFPYWDDKHPRSFLMEVPGVKWQGLLVLPMGGFVVHWR